MHPLHRHTYSNHSKLYKTQHYALQLASHLTLKFNICMMKQTYYHYTHTWKRHISDNNHSTLPTHSILSTNTPHTPKHLHTPSAYTLPQSLHTGYQVDASHNPSPPDHFLTYHIFSLAHMCPHNRRFWIGGVTTVRCLEWQFGGEHLGQWWTPVCITREEG